MDNFERITILGAGTIGMSWAALYLACGKSVTVYDPSVDIESKMLAFVETTRPALLALGHKFAGNVDKLGFDNNCETAVQNAQFIQESIPERLDLKHALYKKIEPYLDADTIVATSTSGLTLSALQQGFTNSAKLILAHPFNPPHLIPLVELMANQHTDMQLFAKAEAFYQSLGKQTIRLKKEVTGHIANRLQAALWRECIHLFKEDVASLEDIDKAVAFGPGLRWAALGPSALFHLGGGDAGITGFCEHIGPPMQTWWDDLGKPDLDTQTIHSLVAGMNEITDKTNTKALQAKRDLLIVEYLKTQQLLAKKTTNQ
jgi:3-hydroxybutyryl-CoA dehydrogenase